MLWSLGFETPKIFIVADNPYTESDFLRFVKIIGFLTIL